MAIASPPSDMRLADIPRYFIHTAANARENGMASRTTTLGRSAPRNTRAITTTSTSDSVSARLTVLTHASTRLFCS